MMTEKELEQWRIENAEDRGRTEKQIEEIEDELYIFITRRAERTRTVENTKAMAKVAECYFELSRRFEDKVPLAEKQIRSIKESLFRVAREWTEKAETAEEVEALAAVSHAISEMPWYR